MLKNRVHSYDYIRVIAILMIVICHYFLFSNLNSGIGRFLSSIGNMEFILLSALLYGRDLTDRNTGGDFCSIDFFKKRIIKLGGAVWPFLILLLLLFLILGVHFSWSDVFLNFIFLGYLGQLPGNGHLWFLTVIMACYAEYALLNILSFRAQWFPYGLLIGSVSLMIILETAGVPGNAVAILGFYGFMLIKTDKFLQMSKSLNVWMMLLIVLVIIFMIWLDIEGLLEKSRVLHWLLSDICGVLLLALLIRFMPTKENRIVTIISGMSFDIYIVHHTLCGGPFIRIAQVTEYHIINIILLLVFSLLLAKLLNRVAGNLSRFLLREKPIR